MDLDSNYKLVTGIYAIKSGRHIKLYFDFQEFVKENPDSPYSFGFAVINKATGEIVDEPCDNVEAAFFNWFDNFPEVRHE